MATRVAEALLSDDIRVVQAHINTYTAMCVLKGFGIVGTWLCGYMNIHGCVYAVL